MRESGAAVDGCLDGDESHVAPQRTDHEASDGARLGFCAAMMASTFARGAAEFHNAFDY